MLQILKENITYVSILAVALILVLYSAIVKIPAVFTAANDNIKLEKEFKDISQQLENAKTAAENSTKAQSTKKIYEAQGLQFSADASFAPLLENVINIAKAAGIRFRSIKYNYSPLEDTIYAAKLPGYNVCELNLVAAGTYTQFQHFFKGIIKEEYLNNLAEIEIRPFSDDKTILMANVALRLYTKTEGTAPIQEQPAKNAESKNADNESVLGEEAVN